MIIKIPTHLVHITLSLLLYILIAFESQIVCWWVCPRRRNPPSCDSALFVGGWVPRYRCRASSIHTFCDGEVARVLGSRPLWGSGIGCGNIKRGLSETGKQLALLRLQGPQQKRNAVYLNRMRRDKCNPGLWVESD